MQRMIILHTNDIHGRVEGLARIATLVSQIKAENPETPVLYFDCGDVEEPSQWLSNLTKGAAMHRLLRVAGCQACVTGNGPWMRYGPDILAEHAAVARYPLLGANLRKRSGADIAGVQATAIVPAGGLRLGLVGLTAFFPNHASLLGLVETPPESFAHEATAELVAEGADAVIVLSHLGLPADRRLAAQMAGETPLILGAHTHDLLPEGEQVDGVWIAQAGQYAEHLGRVDLVWDGCLTVTQVRVIPVTADIPLSKDVLAEAERIEAAGQVYLDEVIGELAGPLDFALDRECGAVDLMADALLDRMRGDLAVVAAGQAFDGALPGGPLRRGALWDVCSSTANPGLVTLSGEQLRTLVERGLDPEFAQERPRGLGGQARGLIHLSGAVIEDGALLVQGVPVDPGREYRVAGTDWEFEPYGGYALKEWGLQPVYDVPTIMREALEEYLAGRPPVAVRVGRLG